MTEQFSKWKSTGKEKKNQENFMLHFTLLIIDDKCSSLLNLFTLETYWNQT